MPCRRACRPPWKVASRDSQQPAVEDDCASIQFCPTSRGILSGESPAHAREPGRSSPPKREETHIKCDEQAVEVGVHEATSVVDVALATPAFDSRATSPRASAMLCANSESVI